MSGPTLYKISVIDVEEHFQIWKLGKVESKICAVPCVHHWTKAIPRSPECVKKDLNITCSPACNTAPSPNFQMPPRGPPNGLQGLEGGPTPVSLILLFLHVNLINQKWPPRGPKIRHGKSCKHASIACGQFLKKIGTFLYKQQIPCSFCSLYYCQAKFQFSPSPVQLELS